MLQPPVYKGSFGPVQAERLLWRAGFGPGQIDLEKFSSQGMQQAVRQLTHPAKVMLHGTPATVNGMALSPSDAWGHDHLWWLDRMVRTSDPLGERLTLMWHDWFATSVASVPPGPLMLGQHAKQRKLARGSFPALLKAMTSDPAMLIWLNGLANNKWAPNENYARELLELFCLGADGAYTERDVREAARALTGFRADYDENIGRHVRFRYDLTFHDDQTKVIFGRRARHNPSSLLKLCVEHPDHPRHLVRRIWGQFIPGSPSASTVRALAELYVKSGRRIGPVVEAVLRHPDLYDPAKSMVVPPAVQCAGMMRLTGHVITSDAWTWVCDLAGQRLFAPPNVSGWDESRWMSTATFRGRMLICTFLCYPHELKASGDVKVTRPFDAEALVLDALAFWRTPTLSASARQELIGAAQAMLDTADAHWKREQWPVLTVNALRMLVGCHPEMICR